MTETRTLNDVLSESITLVSGGICATLQRHVAAMPTAPTLSRATRAQIEKRVPPKALAGHLNPNSAVLLLQMEIADLGTRITRYQYIERYREHFEAPDAAMRTAFVMHTHILRGSEIYVIMEQCGSCLGFLHDLASDLALSPTQMAPVLAKQFGKTFKRHLRERHRIVHAHERPSLISRMIAVESDALDEPAVAETYLKVFSTLADQLKSSFSEAFDQKTPQETLKLINNMRLQAVDQECLEMWMIFGNCLSGAIDRTKLLQHASRAASLAHKHLPG